MVVSEDQNERSKLSKHSGNLDNTRGYIFHAVGNESAPEKKKGKKATAAAVVKGADPAQRSN